VVLFFFQAEDGIRDFHVTGVQTCALPIWSWWMFMSQPSLAHILAYRRVTVSGFIHVLPSGDSEKTRDVGARVKPSASACSRRRQIGRASCRERVQISVGAVRANEREERRR